MANDSFVRLRTLLSILLALPFSALAGINESLIEAAKSGDPASIAALLDSGANPSALSRSGDTPLMEAIYHGHHAAVELLLRRGVSPFTPNTTGSTPMDFAIKYSDQRMVGLLKSAGWSESEDKRRAAAEQYEARQQEQRAKNEELAVRLHENARIREFATTKGWRPLTGNKEFIVFLHGNSKRKVGNLNKSWFLFKYFAPEALSSTARYQSIKRLMYADCQAGTLATGEGFYYSGDLATGTLVHSELAPLSELSFFTAPPDTVAELMLKAVCAEPSARKEIPLKNAWEHM